jgi:hypothetical protein
MDFKKFAQLTGYTEGSAKVTLGNIKRKLKNHASGITGTPASTPKKSATPSVKTPKSGGGKKRAVAEDANGNGNDESPTKKARTPAKAKPKKKREEDADDEFADVKIKSEEVRHVENDFQAFLKQQENQRRSFGAASAGVGGNGFSTVMDGLYAEQEEDGATQI